MDLLIRLVLVTQKTLIYAFLTIAGAMYTILFPSPWIPRSVYWFVLVASLIWAVRLSLIRSAFKRKFGESTR